MAIDNEKLITLGGLAEYNKSIPATAYKAILQSQETALWSPEEIESHIFPVDWELNESLCGHNMTAATPVIEYPVPDGAKYLHFFAACDGCYVKDAMPFLNIYMSVKDNSKITFVEDSTADHGYRANIPDGVKLVSGIGLGETPTSKGLMKASYEGFRSGAQVTESEFPIDISGHNGKLYIQFTFGDCYISSNVVDVPTEIWDTSNGGLKTKTVQLGPNSCMYDEFYPVFYDHYGIAVSTWSTNWRLAMFGKTSFVKL